jgi:hypothetical protein
LAHNRHRPNHGDDDQWRDDDDDDDGAQAAPIPSGKRETGKWRRRFRSLRKTAATLLFAASIAVHRPGVASAAPSRTATATPEKTISIRPGMSQSQVEAVQQGDLSVLEELQPSEPSSSAAATLSPLAQQPSTPFAKTTPSVTSMDYDDEYDDDEDYFSDSSSKAPAAASTTTTTARVADKVAAERLQSSTKQTFAAYHKGKSRGLTIKIGLGFFVPTYGFMIVREYVRRRREEIYVQKGLEILEAQKAEYFNVTGTKTDDSDVQDALKNLKNNTKDDDEEDDDDDDDDDDEPEPTARRPPRKPLGDPPKGGGGDDGGGGTKSGGGPSGGSGNDDTPSAADIDKLNKLLGKS